MIPFVHLLAALGPLTKFLLIVAVIGSLSSTVYLVIVLVAARRYLRLAKDQRRAALATPDSELPPVSIFKPVHGLEPKLAENLASFFEQDYPNFEIVIGARDAGNSALGVAREVCARYPHIPSRIVLSGPPTWPNAKAFSLDKMIADTRNTFLVLSDSDVLVGRDLLRHVVPPLLNQKNGAVTCVYQGVPAGDFASLLEGLGMSVEMTSGVVVADMMEGMRFALGLVIAVRREVLDAIGGIRTTADYYSDDFVLGNEVWKAGFKVVLSHYWVNHVLLPRGWRETVGDQLRWMKSTRYSRPAGHVGSGLTYAMPFGLVGWMAALAGGLPALGWALLGIAFANRVIQSVAVGWGVGRDSRALKFCWLYPLRDLQGFLTWLVSFISRDFYWRGETYRFGKGGRITPKLRPATFVSAAPPPH
ncbi:MAG: glycosyltransferase [Terriglobales bacterium]